MLFPAQLVMAQNPVHLDECQKWAREQHPFLKQQELYQKMSRLKLENEQVGKLPQVKLNAQASYQSDVTHVAISVPGVSIPTVSKDQYVMDLDVKQNIWDGGLIRAGEILEKAQDETNRQGVEVDLYKVRSQVDDLFFNSFLLQENLNILAKKQETLDAERSSMESGVKNGMVLQSDLDQILAELIQVKQQQIELQSDRETVLSALAILTGREVNELQDLVIDTTEVDMDGPVKRPELDLFKKQTALLAASANWMQKKRNPKVFGFGQAGYGRPGLNMLKNDFEPYYRVGVGLNWTVADWKTVRRTKEIVRLQQEMVKTREQEFDRNLRIALDRENRKIGQLEHLLQSDRDLIGLQERITKSSASKLKNGTITTSDYIKNLNAEMAARITYKTHVVQLEAARIDYQTIQGK